GSNSTLPYQRSPALTSLSVAGGSFDHCWRRSAMSSSLGVQGSSLSFAALTASTIPLGSRTSMRCSVRSLPCWETAISWGNVLDLPSLVTVARATTNHTPRRSTGSFPVTVVCSAYYV